VDEEFDKQTETEVAAKPQIMAEVPVSFERSEVVQSAAIPHSAVKVRSIKQAEKTSPSKNMIKDLLQTLVIALLLFVAINIVSARVLVDGNSMEPTLENLDRIIVNRLAYKFDDFSYGDVVVFPSPYNNYEDYIKRVIALPGDSIEIRSGQVFVNNRLLEEKYVLESPLEGLEKETMPPGMVFVMGDNRNASSDSRDWGPLPIDSIIGKAVFVYWPIDHVGAIPTPDVFFSTP
jgi:signal peptidase I